MPEFFIPGPRGRLEARLAGSADPSSPVAVVLHPHPLHGGTMNTKVAFALFRSLAEVGCHTVRFNFRGVGRSSGEHAGGDGEVEDALAVVDWMQRRHPQSSTTWIAGFSFGAWIAARVLMKCSGISRFVLVAPDATTRDWSFLDQVQADGLIIQGRADTIVAPDDVATLAGIMVSFTRSLRFEMIEDAGHFFEEHMEDVRELVRDHARRPR